MSFAEPVTTVIELCASSVAFAQMTASFEIFVATVGVFEPVFFFVMREIRRQRNSPI